MKKLFLILALGACFNCNAQIININLVETSISSLGDNDDTLSASLVYSVEAVDSDVWLKLTSARSGTGQDTGLTFKILEGANQVTMNLVSASHLDTTADVTSDFVLVQEGHTATFDLNVFAQFVNSSVYRVQLDALMAYSAPEAVGVIYNFSSDVRTNFIFIQGSSIPEPHGLGLVSFGLGCLMMRRRRK